MRHQSWCNKRGIKIYFEPMNWREGRLVIDDNGKIQKSKTIYKQKNLKIKDKRYHVEAYKLYTKIYMEFHNGQI